MRTTAWLWLLSAALSAAQTPGMPTYQPGAQGDAWRRTLGGLPERPPLGSGARDLERFDSAVQLAAPYLLNGGGDIEANREVVRRMWMYLAGLEALARMPGADRGFSRSIQRSRSRLGSLGLAYPYWMPGGPAGSGTPPPAPEPTPRPGDPPFPLRAPEVGAVKDSDRDLADEIVSRYESTAAKAGAAWQSADLLGQSLARRGMTLNQKITESVVRLQMFLELAAGDIRRHNWPSARQHLERVDYVVGQVTASVGR